jgi:uncharacterized protein YebE (UPF0316 family)
MNLGLDAGTLGLGLIVFAARVFDVTMGTLRTISIVHGRTRAAFALGLLEVSMWLMVITAVVGEIADRPILGIFYALGFSTGNVVGILVEQRLALGHVALRVFSAGKGRELAEKLRAQGVGVTSFQGEGMSGPVTMLFVVCGRKDLRKVMAVLRQVEPNAFYTIETTGSVSKILRMGVTPPTGWRAIAKRK